LEYYPPSEAAGGWRKNTDPHFIHSVGMNPDKLSEFGEYNISLPNSDWKPWSDHKGVLVIKNGWIVGEWYEKENSYAFRQYLASNGKAFAIVCLGIVIDDSRKGNIPFEIDIESKLYDLQWLSEGFPLSDPRKNLITFHQILNHTSGLCPEGEEEGRYQTDKDFVLWVLGRDLNYTETARLYYDPGHSEQYPKGSSYSSVGFQHIGLIIPHLTGMPAHEFIWKRILEPIGFSGIKYFKAVNEWSAGDQNRCIKWHTDGGLRMTTRDYVRFAYLLLRDGKWRDHQIVSASWIQRFRRSGDYVNMMGNKDGHFGKDYPEDMFRIAGAGMNWAFVIPSLDLIVVRTSRNNLSWDKITSVFLEKLFASIS